MLSYKIILDNNSTCFSSEVDYVSRYIERCYLVKRTNSDKADVIISYGKSMKCDSNIHLTPELMEFALSVNNNGISLVDKKPVIHALKKCMAKNNEKYTTSSTGVVCFKEDLIALSFILLSRIEERSSLELDQHERYSINNDIVFCAGLYGLPIVDMLIDEFIDIAFDGRVARRLSYSIKITHDIDRLRSYHSIWKSTRSVLGDIVKRMNPTLALQRLRNELNLLEPWSSQKKLIDIYSKLGFRATFFVMGPSLYNMDSTYFLRMPKLLKSYIKLLLKNGHEIGLHPGYESFYNKSIYSEQKQSVEELLEIKLTSARQHVLRFNIEQTPLIASKCGIKSDFTLAYPELLGFRNGTTRGMNAFDFFNRKPIDLLMYSTSIVDFTLHGGKYNTLSLEEASNMANRMIYFCKKYDGKLVTLYHTGYMINRHFQFYRKILESI